MANPGTSGPGAEIATLEKLLSSVGSYRAEAAQRMAARGIRPTPTIARRPLEISLPEAAPEAAAPVLAPVPVAPVAPPSIAPVASVVPRPATVALPPAAPIVPPPMAPQAITPTPPVLPQALTATPDVRAAELSARSEDPSKVTTKLPTFLSPPAPAPGAPLVPELAARPVPQPAAPAPLAMTPAPSTPGPTPTSVVRPLPMPAPISNREPSGSFRAVPHMMKEVAGQFAPTPSEARRPGSAPSTQIVPSQTLGEFLKKFNLTA